jgi:hypothetical protein
MPNEQPSKLSKIVNGGLRSIAASFPGLASFGQAWRGYENYRTGDKATKLILQRHLGSQNATTYSL